MIIIYYFQWCLIILEYEDDNTDEDDYEDEDDNIDDGLLDEVSFILFKG